MPTTFVVGLPYYLPSTKPRTIDEFTLVRITPTLQVVMVEMRPRAERFPLPLPLRWRILGTTDWSSGQSQNISGSGILFAAGCECAVGTQLELRLALAASGKSYPGEIAARAQIVRIEPQSAVTGPALAARFEEHRIVPRSSRER